MRVPVTSLSPKGPESPKEVALALKLGKLSSEPGSAIHELCDLFFSH